jgi:hypothetical protein
MKTTRFSLVAVSAALAVAALQPFSLRAQSDPAAPATTSDAAQKDAQRLKIASPIEEIVQLNQSGVGDPVIVNYIQNSDRTYRLNAQDIIKLRDQGVSTEVTTALIQRGAEQRQATAEADNQRQATEATTVAVAPTYQTPPAETPASAVTYYEPVEPRSTVSVTYFGSSGYGFSSGCYPGYRYYSPSYRYYNYSPGYCYTPQVSFGISLQRAAPVNPGPARAILGINFRFEPIPSPAPSRATDSTGSTSCAGLPIIPPPPAHCPESARPRWRPATRPSAASRRVAP